MIEGSAMEGIGIGELAMRLRDMAFQQKEKKEKKGKWKYILGWRGEGGEGGEGLKRERERDIIWPREGERGKEEREERAWKKKWCIDIEY